MLVRSAHRHAARGIAGALCAVLLACSGGDGPTDPTGPGPAPTPPAQPGPPAPAPPQEPPAQPPAPPAPPVPVPPPAPEPTDNIIVGAYALGQINESVPGQMVMLVHPDGTVLGLYRFHENSLLGLTEDQTWTLTLRFEDEQTVHVIEDHGTFTRTGEDLRELTFQSDVYGDSFEGRALDGAAAIKYDVDGDGQHETIFGFQRLLGPGD